MVTSLMWRQPFLYLYHILNLPDHNASANGSVIATDILAELKKNLDVSECIKGTANYFKTKRRRQNEDDTPHIKIMFTVCTKDVTNPNFPDKDNPQASWFNENRTEVEPSTFVKYFKNLPEYSDDELTYFANAICIDVKLMTKVVSKMSDIYDAYLGENYVPYRQSGTSSLHTSCMRDEESSRNAADFYYHFAGAKLIIDHDSTGLIYGRAILWEKAIVVIDDQEHNVSVLDRCYFSHSFVIDLLHNHARRLGVHFRKTRNDFSSKSDFTVLNRHNILDIEENRSLTGFALFVRVPASKWHKMGAPYMDTFTYLSVANDNELILANKSTDRTIAKMEYTSGYGSKMKNYCSRCGKVHTDTTYLCYDCESEVFVSTAFGDIMLDKTVDYKGLKYPASFFRRGKPCKHLRLFLQIQKIYS